MADLRALLDADRDRLLDVADWLASMPQENFDKHVRMDISGQLDPEAAKALRHKVNLHRWHDALCAIVVGLQNQLADPMRKAPEFDDWRRRVLNFQNNVLKRHNEAKELVRQERQQKLTAAARAASNTARKDAGERAIKRLIAEHRAEFIGYLAEEYASDGIRMSDGQYRELRDLATRVEG